jgi:hypothetical protein
MGLFERHWRQAGDECYFNLCSTTRPTLIMPKNPPSSFECLRTNGGAVEIIKDYSVHAEPVKAFLEFFSRIITQDRPRQAASFKLLNVQQKGLSCRFQGNDEKQNRR